MKKRIGWILLGFANGLTLGVPSWVPSAPSAATMVLLSAGAVLFGLLKK